MSGAKDPYIILNRLVLDITNEAKHHEVPLWRAQTHTAKVLLACCQLFLECETMGEVRARYSAQVRPLIVKLLGEITDEPEALLADCVNNQGV